MNRNNTELENQDEFWVVITIPYWFNLIILTIVLLLGTIVYSRLDRARLIYCKKCGYTNKKGSEYCDRCGVILRLSRKKYLIGDETFLHVVTPEWLLIFGAIIILFGVEYYRQKWFAITNSTDLWIYVYTPIIIGALCVVGYFYFKLKK